MASKILILAFVFFTIMFTVSASKEPAYQMQGDEYVFGSFQGAGSHGAKAGVPVGGPVAGRASRNMTLHSPRRNGATAATLDYFTTATAIVSTIIAGSFFF